MEVPQHTNDRLLEASTATPKECPKCQYVRQAEDSAPVWQCPSCGIAYGKYTSSPPANGNEPKILDLSPPVKIWGSRFKTARITVLLVILIFVAVDTGLTRLRVTSWDHTLRVVVYPINADGSDAATKYIAGLNAAQFYDIEQSVKEQAMHYGLTLDDPVEIALAKPVDAIPPPQPHDQNMFKVMWWSLKLRLWASNMDYYDGPTPEVRAFTLYYDPKTHPVLEHSTGLEKGMIGVIKLFASDKMSAENNIVMLHELLHTLGATDKYDLRTDQPIYPTGYAEPRLRPLLPQKKAEIMAGRTPITSTHAVMPDSLADVVIGPDTAREIGWIR
jgi:hypothetical protein